MSIRSRDENRFVVVRGQVTFCATCVDVFGQIDDRVKRCECTLSAGLPEVARRWDFPTPFEVCWYCQAELIRSGSKWSNFFCEGCRPFVLPLNDSLDAIGQVSLPAGRHSFMHVRWDNARPFTAIPVVNEWKRDRLARAWNLHGVGASSCDWVDFSPHLVEGAESRRRALLELAAKLQGVAPDVLSEAVNEANRRLHGGRALDIG